MIEPVNIAIITLLVFMVLIFLGIVVAVAVSVAKIQHVVEPIKTTVRTIRRVGKAVKGKARTAARQVRDKVRTDLKSLQRGLRSKIRNLRVRLRQPDGRRMHEIIERGIGILSGNPCSKLEQLWINHIDLTFYYGMLALSSLAPITADQQQKLDYTAGELLQIQQDLSNMMSPCVAEAQKPVLTQLLKDHILIVAQIASVWRQKPAQGFDPMLVRKWYQNADDTVKLLSGETSTSLAQAYRQHLDMTAKYLQAIAEDRSLTPTSRVWLDYANAVSHAPTLASAFCGQLNVCQRA